MHMHMLFHAPWFRSLKYLFFVSSLVLSFRSKAQTIQDVDSLLVVVAKQQHEAQYVQMLQTSLDILSMSNAINYDKGVSRGHFFVAAALLDMGVIEETFNHLEAVEQTKYYQQNPMVAVEVLRLRGRAFMWMGLYQQALTQFKKQIPLFSKLKKELRLWGEMMHYSNLTYLYGKMEENSPSAADSLEKYAFLQLSVLNEMPEERVANAYVGAYNHISWANILKKNYDKSAEALDKAMTYVQKYNLPVYYNLEMGYAEIALSRNNYEEAKMHLQRMLENARESGNSRSLSFEYEHIAKMYVQYNLNRDTANMYLLKSQLLRDSLDKENKKVIDVAMTYLLQAKEKEKRSFYEQPFWLYIGGAALLVALSSLAYALWHIRKKNQDLQEKETVLQEQEAMTQELSEVARERKYQELLLLAKGNNPEFLPLFTELYPEFIAALKALDPKVRSSELEFCAMTYLNFSTKHIAEYTFVTVRAVQIRKNRLRKKYNIPSDVDFNLWMSELGAKSA